MSGSHPIYGMSQFMYIYVYTQQDIITWFINSINYPGGPSHLETIVTMAYGS